LQELKRALLSNTLLSIGAAKALLDFASSSMQFYSSVNDERNAVKRA
jgi:hypothetical protein